MPLDIHTLMRRLSPVRPVFHSEADLQFALAWQVREEIPDCTVRLEYKPFITEALYLDIWIPTLGAAIELKYKTRQLLTVDKQSAEVYALRDHGAHDHARYDFLTDVQRLERIVRERPSANQGFAVLLTNDRRYWDVPAGETETDDAAFRLHEGRDLSGPLTWAHKEKLDAKGAREQPIALSGAYQLRWHDYSNNAASAAGMAKILGQSAADQLARHSRFRYLAVTV